ncbi:MAG: TIGR03790 family protein [Halioglobus sp.]|nr:TIGR03790 family protein [Halioglobus sp.]
MYKKLAGSLGSLPFAGFIFILWALAGLASAEATGISNLTLALIVNDNDPQSVAVAKYYADARQIPPANVIHTRFRHEKPRLSAQEFSELEDQVKRQLPAGIQAYALTWTLPYKVECMSISAAFALGFDRAYCAKSCKPTRQIPYYNSNSAYPFRDFGIRPTMMLAGENEAQVRKLIDRGVAADSTRPGGRAYLLSTSSKARNVRSPTFPYIAERMGSILDVEIIEADFIDDRDDILFYFTGVTRVQNLASNTFLPGAIGDHLTSTGGVLFGTRQMSALRWLEAGATGSYGTVTEPCSFPSKFPHPAIVIQKYLDGDTLIEAYWKSVAMPGQGIFIGEPLAAPFKGCSIAMTRAGVFEFENSGGAGQAPELGRRCRNQVGGSARP